MVYKSAGVPCWLSVPWRHRPPVSVGQKAHVYMCPVVDFLTEFYAHTFVLDKLPF